MTHEEEGGASSSIWRRRVRRSRPETEESSAAALAELDSVEGRFPASSEKESDRLRKVRDRAKNQAEALRQIEVIDKPEHEAAVVKIVDYQKKVMKGIAAKHYREMRDYF